MPIESPQSGFTLIETMIVSAVVGILLAIAMPAYTNYAVRSKVGECVGLASAAKMAVHDRVMRSGQAPGSSKQAAFRFEATEHCADIRIADGGKVVVETQNTGASEDPVIEFRLDPDTVVVSVEWDCSHVSGEPAHVPSSCRAADLAGTVGDDTVASSEPAGERNGTVDKKARTGKGLSAGHVPRPKSSKKQSSAGS